MEQKQTKIDTSAILRIVARELRSTPSKFYFYNGDESSLTKDLTQKNLMDKIFSFVRKKNN